MVAGRVRRVDVSRGGGGEGGGWGGCVCGGGGGGGRRGGGGGGESDPKSPGELGETAWGGVGEGNSTGGVGVEEVVVWCVYLAKLTKKTKFLQISVLQTINFLFFSVYFFIF
mgnify:CR=1 FL=1